MCRSWLVNDPSKRLTYSTQLTSVVGPCLCTQEGGGGWVEVNRAVELSYRFASERWVAQGALYNDCAPTCWALLLRHVLVSDACPIGEDSQFIFLNTFLGGTRGELVFGLDWWVRGSGFRHLWAGGL